MPNKVLKTIQIKWKWHGDLYLLKGFNICLMPSGKNPVDNPDRIIVFNKVLPNADIINNEYIFSYNFMNQPLDEGSTCVPWVQALYDNSDSQWASMGGQVIEDDGQATIVVVGNPTFQQIIDMADDDKITPQEKLQLQKEWEEVVAEHQQIEIGVIKADILNSQEVTEYVNAVQNLAKYLNYNLVYDFTSITNENFIYPSMLIDKLTTDLNTKHYNGKECYNLTWRTYYEARINILEKIRDQLFENNKAEIEDWLGQNNLPTTIETGGYISNKLTANMNYDNKNTPGYIKVHFGTFITPTGVKFSIEGNKHVPTGLSSNKNGIVYLIFVGADTSRFSFSSKNDSQQFICATHNGKEWFYLHNGEEKRFKPNTEDCIVAKVEEFATDDNNNGIKAIKLFASNGESIFNALTDGGKSQGVYRDEETGLIYINAEFMKIGVIKSQNGKSEFDLNDGSFRLGGTEANDYRDYSLKFDGKDLHLGQGSIKWENLDETAKDHMQSISVNIIGGVRTISVNGKNQVLTTPTAYTASVKSGTTDITNNCTFNWKAVGIFSGNGNSISFTPIKSSYTEAETFIQLTIAYNSEIYEERIPISVSKAGLDGTNAITYYTWVKYADGPNGEGISSSPAGKEYIGIAYNKATSTPSNTPKDYAWSLIKGEDGIPGVNGIDGKTYYTWIKYADSPTSGMSDSPNGKLYMGIAYNRETKNESTNYNDYSWSLIKGADGQDGVNGKTYYTWIRYADSPTTGISSSPVGKMYIGIAYNKTTNTPSGNYNDYSWSLIKGKDGVPGTNGIDGKTYFTWIKYADTPTSGMSDNPDGKKYIGLAYNKTTSIESNSYNDYAWSLIKGKDGVDGVDGKDGKDGINAQYVLVSGEQTFKYTNNFSGIPTPTSITLTAIAIGYANPRYQWSYKTAGSTIVTNIANATNSTYILTHNNSIWGDNKQLTLRCTCGDHYDEMTIVKVSDGINGVNGQDGAQGPAGKDAYTVILTNENHTFATDSNGNIPTALSTTTTVIAYKGAASITPAIGNIIAPTGMNVTKSGAVITVTASTGTSLADTGTFNIPVTVDGRSFTKTFTWSKSKQGHTGPAGANGTSATAYWLISSASAIGKNTSNVYNPTSVTFTAKYQTGTSTVTNYNGRFIIAESTNGTDFTNKYTSSANEASKVWSPSSTSVKSIRVRLYQAGGTSVILDEQIIPIVTDGTNGINGTNGASAVTAVLSNESHNIPCNTAGTPTTYAGAVTTMSVFVGASDTSSSWTYTVQTTNISGTSSNNNRTYTVTGISADVGYVDLTASRNGYSSVTKRFTVVKAKQGATGAQGPAGSNGQDANLLDWVKEWNGTKTEIGGTKVVTPKLFAGTVTNSKPTGVALGVNVLGTGSSFSGLSGYKEGIKTYHLGTDGTLLIGNQISGSYILFDGSALAIRASSISISGNYVATSADVSSVNNKVNGKLDNNQKSVFNTLTNNSANQGIYLSGTNLYVNATYIKAGTLDAARLNVSSIVSSINNQSTTIHGDKITTGTIKTEHIHTNGLHASVIKAGTIDAARLSISGTGTNLIKNGAFLHKEEMKFWREWGTCTRIMENINGKKWLNIYTNNNEDYRGILQITDEGSVVVGRTYTVSVLAMPYSVSNYNKKLNIGVHILDSSGTILEQFWNDIYSDDSSVGNSQTIPRQIKFSFTPTHASVTKINLMIGGQNRVAFDFRITDIMLTSGSLAGEWVGHQSEVNSANTIIDDDGLTVLNGKIAIKNTRGTTVFNTDSDGNLSIVGSIKAGSAIRGSSISGGTITGASISGGTLRSSNGDMYFDMNDGFIILYNNGVKIGQTQKNHITGTSIYGISQSSDYGNYSALSTKITSGATLYTMMLTATGVDLTSSLKKGVNLGAHFHSNNWDINMGSASKLQWRQNGSNYDSFISEDSGGMLRIYGDNGVYLGYRNGSSNTYVICIREGGNHTYPRSLNMFNTDDSISKSEYAIEINAPIKMRGQSINECTNIKSLNIEIVDPVAFSSDVEEHARTYTVTKNSQNIVEFIGSTEIVNKESIIMLPQNIAFKNYVVILSPVGLHRNVSLVEKNNDNFKIVGDNGTVDYVIKFESVKYAKYMSSSIDINNVDIIQRNEDDKPREITLEDLYTLQHNQC